MKKHKPLIILIILLFALSCKKKNNSLEINATLKNITNGTLFTLYNFDSKSVLDSAYIHNGHLSLKGKINSVHPEKLRLSAIDSLTGDFIFTDILVANEIISFEADRDDFPYNLDIKGSKYHDEMEKFHKILSLKNRLIRNLNENFNGSDKTKLNARVNEIQDSLNIISAELVKREFNTYAALKSFKYYKNSFTNKELSELYNSLDESLKNTNEAEVIKLQSEHPEPKIGSKYYDYTALNYNQDTVSISDYNGKFRLLHFSSYNCYYSQSSIPELKKLYEEHSNELEIIAISNDPDEDVWLNTVKRDSITWTYLWDGKADNNDANIKYWKTGTPNYVLISPDGLIVEQWYGYDIGLINEKLYQYFNN